MALSAYLKLKGEVQGDIKGSVTKQNVEGQIQVFSYSFGSDASDGKPYPGEFMVALESDQSTPLILNAFVNQETITSFELDLYGVNGSGEEFLEQTWELTNGNVTSFRTGGVIGSTTDSANEVTFTFETLVDTWTIPNITAEWDVGKAEG